MDTTNLQSGDIILFHTKFKWYNSLTWVSALIRIMTNGNYNHVGLVVMNWDIPFINESSPFGIVTKTAAEYLKDKEFIVLRLKDEYYDFFLEKYFNRIANSKLGNAHYDYKAIFIYYPFLLLTGRWIGSTIENNNDKLMVCSEYVAWCYEQYFEEKLNSNYTLPAWYLTTPKDFENCKMFDKIYDKTQN